MDNIKFERLLGDENELKGIEGPVFDTKAQFYICAPEREVNGKSAGTINKVDLATNTQTVFATPVFHEVGGIPAGLQCDTNDCLWAADMRHGLLKITSDGTVSQVATEVEKAVLIAGQDPNGPIGDKEPLQGCNDLAFDSKGNLYVTAPAGPIAPHEYLRSTEKNFGAVYVFLTGANGEIAEGRVRKLADDFLFSNGIAVSKDDSFVAVAETFTKTIWRFDLSGPGCVTKRSVWHKLPGTEAGGPDGMDFDAKGNLVIAHWGSSMLEVLSPTEGLLNRVQLPFACPSNVHFHPDGSGFLLITEHTNHALWKCMWPHGGQPQYCDKKEEKQ
eukprot:m.154642 g.154642  ORF g.154642 m.154642 type:complete len:330 (+) comp24634_c0_seq4:121-1110(+)